MNVTKQCNNEHRCMYASGTRTNQQPHWNLDGVICFGKTLVFGVEKL